MLEDRLQEPVSLRVPTGNFTDGEAEYTEYSGYALITDFTRRDLSRYGSIKNGKIFLLRCAAEPLPGSRMIHQGQTYDLKDITVCRDLDGQIECYRCVVM
ncbi:MAG: hypothetical protein PHH77_02345 [Victivallaceae bacterium]|nr:hypothetical protein [Victivallaceae bacterium]